MKLIDKKDMTRLLVLSFFIFVLFFLVIFQFFKVQILDGKKWRQLAKCQHLYSTIEPFKRGRFFGQTSLKKGHLGSPVPFVFDVKKFHLYIDPLSLDVSVYDEMTQTLFNLLDLNWEEHNFVRLQFEKRSRSKRLKRWLSYEEKGKVLEWWKAYSTEKKLPKNGLYFVEDYKRSYPYGNLLGAVLNTVQDDRDISTQQSIPIGGMEHMYDSYLQGSPGKRLQLRSPTQSLETGRLVSVPEDGADIYLTIDPYIQAIVEQEMEKAVQQAKARSGWAVMMDPTTGQIHALAQYPGFDPADYRTYYNDPEMKNLTSIQAVSHCFEPGSTMKPISLAIALLANHALKEQGKEAIFDPLQMIPTWDGAFPGRKTSIRDVREHRYLNMDLAIQKSSNIYVAKIIQRVIAALGDEWYRTQLEEVFGFGKKTGVELPSESPGLLPSPYKKYMSGRPQWSAPTPYSLSFGYNLLTNTMQLMRAWGILINGGFDVQPTLVSKIMREKEGGISMVLFENNQKESRRVLPEGISDEIIKALKAITKPGGTGALADIPGFTEAGKTSTTEKIVGGKYSKKHHFSSFIGFSPSTNPKFLLFIGVDEPANQFLPGVGRTHYGGKCAAPAFRRIMRRTYDYMGESPDDPFGYLMGDPRFDKKKADWTEEVQKLKDLYSKWN